MKNLCNEIFLPITAGGVKQGELVLTKAQANTNTTVLSYIKNWNIMLDEVESYSKILTSAIVDGETWYTIHVSKDISKWIRQQNEQRWHESLDRDWYTNSGTFDVHEELYTMLQLRW